SGTGALSTKVDLPVGASVTFSFSANISPNATGTLVNTATVTPPPGETDNNPNNNTATDTDTLTPMSDLHITKLDNVGGIFNQQTNTPTGGAVGAGHDNTVTYTIVVSNSGPSTAVNQTVTDNTLTGIAVSDSWSAIASPGSSVTTGSGTGN